MNRFAGLWSYAESTPVNVPLVTGTLVPLTYERSQATGMEVDHAAGKITAQVPGYYMGFFNITFIGTTGATYFFEFRQNGIVGAGFRCAVDGLTGGASNASMIAGAILADGDVIEIYYYSDTVGAVMTVVDVQVGMVSL